MRASFIALFATIALCVPAFAQLQVPDVGGTIGGTVGQATDVLGQGIDGTQQSLNRNVARLMRARERTLSRLLRRNSDRIERDANGDLARRGELLALALDGPARAALSAAGFAVGTSEEIEGLGLSVTSLKTPQGMQLAQAQALAQRLAPGADVSADSLHFQSGAALVASSSASAPIGRSAVPIALEVGVIDTAPGARIRVAGERGFASGAPAPADHGSAVVALLHSAGVERIRVADVYGKDPAGGNALAIARALGWLTQSGSKVVTISLVGPRNPVLGRAVAAAQARGVVVVAAVGNDGPAAPVAYPASYDGVVAVTGVDRRNRALIEAGRALHLDYAAPADRVYAYDRGGKIKRWRGTSFATPLVAARIADALQHGRNWRVRSDAEARDLGKRGPDQIFGRGLLCEGCAQEK